MRHGKPILALAALLSLGIAPPFVPDSIIAQSPVIVVARWKGAPLVNHSKVRPKGDGSADLVCDEWEVFTEIEIERVIQGDIQPGPHTIMTGFRIGWFEHGGPVIAFWSTEMIGDVREVTEPNLWFLHYKKSWDPADTKTYLLLDTYRSIQPLDREAHFLSLRSPPEAPGPEEVPSNLSPWLPGLVLLGIAVLVAYALACFRSWWREPGASPSAGR